MPLIRPDLTRAAHRWRETLTGGAVAVLGLWAGLAALPPLSWIGWVAALAGAGLAVGGIQRGRFRDAGDAPGGPGIVTVTEGQVAYWGPLDGGAVALDALRSLALDPTGRPPHWVLEHDLGPPLHIPVTAAGGEALFDLFAQLPGLSMEDVLRARTAPGRTPRILWRRAGTITALPPR